MTAVSTAHGQGDADVLVLGAGIVGVSAALHLQQRGRRVALIDRRGAGEETSYGNAGLIERSSVIPYGVPRDLRILALYALNRSADVRFDWLHVPRLTSWLWRFWRESSPSKLRGAAGDMLPLIERSLIEHENLMAEAGLLKDLRKGGWIDAFRTPGSLDRAVKNAESLRLYGLRFDVLDRAELQRREPHLSDVLIGGIHWLDAASVPDPGAVVKGYAKLFEKRGGEVLEGDARTLRQDGSGWSVQTQNGRVGAREVVVALGPWSDMVLRPLGYRVPLAVKRGYHRHFRPASDAVLHHPVVDTDGGYLLAPMAQGIRLTTGIEFAPRDSVPTPQQLERTEPLARTVFPLGTRLEAEPWMGSRPCLPDMRPVIGPAPRHPGMWLAFGHNHHGFTLGPVTGRLIAEMITGQQTFTDPAPYAVTRFRGAR